MGIDIRTLRKEQEKEQQEARKIMESITISELKHSLMEKILDLLLEGSEPLDVETSRVLIQQTISESPRKLQSKEKYFYILNDNYISIYNKAQKLYKVKQAAETQELQNILSAEAERHAQKEAKKEIILNIFFAIILIVLFPFMIIISASKHYK